MKIAITTLNKTVSPRLDSADSLLIYEIDKKVVKKSKKINLASYPLYHIISLLRRRGIEIVVCGSCPKPFIRILNSIGVEIIFNAIKDPDIIIQKLIKGEIKNDIASPRVASKRNEITNRAYKNLKNK